MKGDHSEPPGTVPARPTLSTAKATVGGGMASVEHDGTRNWSTLHADTTVKLSKSITSRVKLEHARPRIILLAACLVYFITVLATFQIAVASISNVVSPEYERANDQLHAYSSALHKERIIHSRLEAVLASQLKRGFMDTHEDCLVHGLEKADYELLGLGFRYPDVRDQVIEWTTENCGRLQFVPQAVIEEPTPQEAVLTYWATVNYRARQIAEDVLGFVKQKFNRIWTCFRSSSSPHNASHVDDLTADANISTSGQVLPERSLPQVPYGFALECDSGQPCRLFYPAELAARFDQPNVSPEFLAQLEQHTAAMRTLDTNLVRIQEIIIKASILVRYLEIPLLVCSLIAFTNSITLKTTPARVVPGKEETYLTKSILIEQATYLAILSLENSPAIMPSIRCAVIFTFFTALLGLSMATKFLTRGSQLETMYNVWDATRDLYLLARNRDIPGEEKISTSPPSSEKARKNQTTTNTPPHTNAAVVSQPFKPHHYFANPTTSVKEDLKASISLLHNARQKQAAVKSDADVDTDTDSASDIETFVDLAGGVANEVNDTGCGWSLVG